jgi:hypothetical protein
LGDIAAQHRGPAGSRAHTGLTADPDAEADRLFKILVAPVGD